MHQEPQPKTWSNRAATKKGSKKTKQNTNLIASIEEETKNHATASSKHKKTNQIKILPGLD